MRTTLTLDSDVAFRLNARIKETRRPLKEVVNDALRIGLNAQPEGARPRFEVKPHALGLRPGVDPDKLNQLLDEAEVEELVKKARA